MVCADDLIAGLQPQLSAFLSPPDAQRATTILAEALKVFAGDALEKLNLVRDRARADLIESDDRLERSLDQCKTTRREWQHEVRQQRETFQAEEAKLLHKLKHARAHVHRLTALAAASAVATAAEGSAVAAAAEAERKRSAAQLAAQRLRLKQQARAHAALLAAQLLANSREANARLHAALCEVHSLDHQLAVVGSENAALSSELELARSARARTEIVAKEALSNGRDEAALAHRRMCEDKDQVIASYAAEVDRLRMVASRVLKAKESGPEAALQLLFFETLKRPQVPAVTPSSPTRPSSAQAAARVVTDATAEPRPVYRAISRRGQRAALAASRIGSPRSSHVRPKPPSELAAAPRPLIEPWRQPRLNTCQSWRAGVWGRGN